MHTPQVRLAASCAALIIGSVWLTAQQSDEQAAPVFRSGTELIQVDVSVLDNRRQPVRGLTAEDFTIFEDGQPRPVETFTFVDLPDRITSGDAAWTTEVPPDVTTNQIVEQEGRLVVILMDRSIPIGMPTLTAREIATAAVNELGPTDMAALVSTSGGVPQNFTSDRTRLLRAIEQRDWSTGTSAEAQEIDTATHGGFEGVFTSLTDGRCLCGLCVPDTITRVAEALEDVSRRRKSLLFIGSDFVVQAGPQVQQAEIGCGQKLEDAREKMFAALDRAGVTVHGIDPGGLATVGPTSQASSTLDGGRAFSRRPQAVQEQLVSQNNLHVVPDHTGGRTVMNTNAPQARVPDIVRESQSYYLLGFRPSEEETSRPVRSIEVKVDRRGVNVRARSQFVVPDETATAMAPTVVGQPAPSAAAMGGLLPNAHAPIELHLATFALPDSRRAAVAVAVDVDAFAPAPDASRDTPLEIIVGAFDATGRPQASARQSLDLSWPAPVSGVATRRVEALSRLDLDPGDYEIRVAVAGADLADAASVFTHLTVPDYTILPFSISHVVFAAGSGTTTAPPEFLAGILPVVPTTARTFARTTGATAFLRVYQGTMRRDDLQPVAIRVRIIDVQGTTVRDQVLGLAPEAFAADRTANATLTVPVQNLLPGEYLLRLEASMGDRVVGRAVRFGVK